MKIKIRKPPKQGWSKVDIEIENHDIWSADHTLALIILPLLLELKENHNGIPGNFEYVGGEDWQDQQCFDFYTETHNWAFEQSCKNWVNTLDKMIWSFQQIAYSDYESQYHHNSSDITLKTSKDDNGNEITVLDGGKHWFDVEGAQLHEERIQEGLDLFAKYYKSLWT